MSELQGLSRRSLLKGATAVGVAGATSATGLLTGAQLTAARELPPRDPRAMWRHAYRNGVLYGSAAATWQLTDPGFRRLFDKHAAILFTQDDFLWYVLKPSPNSDLDFTHSDQIVEFAERNNQLVFGAHLVWDEGFGEGWTDKDLWDIGEKRARKHLFGTIRKTVRRYRGRVHIWSVANEVIVNGPDDSKGGLRLDVPWIHTIGPGYVGQAFRVAHEQDPDACLIMNDFGYETVNEFGDKPSTKRRATLQVLDRLLDNDVPVHGIGIQAHLLADDFRERFNAKAYRRFLRELSDRGMQIMITEMDVLDDGLPANPRKRDRMVADVYKRYLNVALDEPALSVVCSFGLSDRYTWLQEDYPRPDGAGRRPLFFNQRLRPKRSYETARYQFRHATKRWPVFETKRRFEG